MCGLWAFRTNNSISRRIKTGIPRSEAKKNSDLPFPSEHNICVATKIMSAPETNKLLWKIYICHQVLNTITTYCMEHSTYILCLIAWEDRGTKLHRCCNAEISIYPIIIQ
jgi:hypothetical protein